MFGSSSKDTSIDIAPQNFSLASSLPSTPLGDRHPARHPRGGAGSARPEGRHCALPGRFPFLNPWFFSWPTWAAEGRAPHASDDGITPTEMSPLFGHSPVANSPIITTCLGLRPALPRGRGERVPPRKSPFASSPGLSPRGHASWADPRGGAGSARPHGNALASPWYAPARPPGVLSPFGDYALSRVRVWPYPPRTRGDRAPPRKSPLALSPGFPRKAIPPWLTPPEGRALHAHKEGMTPTRAHLLLAIGLFAHPPQS